MNWLNRIFSRKHSEARAMLVQQQVGRPVNTPRNYEAFAREGYQKNVIAFKCVSIVSKSCAGIKWFVKSKRTDVELPDNHPLNLLLARPNPMQGGSAFFESVIAYFMISGNSYIEGVRAGNTAPTAELWPMRPDKTRIVPGRFGTPLAFVFTGTNGAEKTFEVNPATSASAVLHMKTFHPTDNWYGMSPIEAAVYSLDQHNESGQWNLSLLQNRATPSGAFVVKESIANPTGTLPDVQFNNLKVQIQEQVQGSRNAGKPLVLEGGLDWKEMGLSPKDMDWLQGRNLSARDICLAFGVPPIILNIPGDATFSNYKEARLAMYEDTIIPLMDFIAGELNRWLAPAFGDDIEIAYDVDSIEALSDKRKAKFDQVSASTFLTTNEKRAALGYEPVDGGDAVLVSSSMVPLDALMEPAMAPPPDENVPADQPASQDNNVDDENDGADESQDTEADFEDDAGDAKKHLKRIAAATYESKAIRQINVQTATGKTRTWMEVNRLRRKLTASMKMDVAEDLQEMAARVSRATKDVTDPRLAEFAMMKAVAESGPALQMTLEKHLKRAAKMFGSPILSAGKDYAPAYETKTVKKFEESVAAFVRTRAKHATNLIEQTTVKKGRAAINEMIAEGVEEGVGTREISTRLQDKFSSLSSSRAEMIARTEISIASNQSTLEAAKALDIPDLEKEWLSVQDDRTRDDPSTADHLTMNGVKAKADENFIVPPDASMVGPGDPSAPAEQIINCRCVLAFARGGKALEVRYESKAD